MEHLLSQLLSLGMSLWDLLSPSLLILPFAFGAVSTANVRRSNDEFVFTITATADADTVTASIAHGMGIVPEVQVTHILAQAGVAFSKWAVTTLDANNIVLTKDTGVGSGNAAAQCRVTVRRPR